MLNGERLCDLRKDKGLTQKEFAEILNINYRTYGGYEREENEASDEIKMKIAKYFNVSVDYLLGVSNYPQPISDGSEYIRLPYALSTDKRKELNEFIKYLMAKE